MLKPLGEWHNKSQEALDTVTKMVVDIAEFIIGGSKTNTATHIVDLMPPMYPYIVHAALRHIHSSPKRKDISWLSGAEDVLQASLDRYLQRWSVNHDWTRGKIDRTLGRDS